ncbi:MAG: SCO family protein [Nitrococcus sp.]|nr:SCO family protein [Nitrococcus sp.]
MSIPRLLRPAAIVFVCSMVLAACSQSPHQFHMTNVTGHMADLALFQMPTADGRKLTAEDLRGKVVTVFFGYTHCPDVCPTALAKLQAVTQRLGEAAKDLRVLFVTVDPTRDTQAVLQRYMESYGPQFIALRPDPEILPKLTSRYHIAYVYAQPDASGNYIVNHTTRFFVFDQTGQMRLIGRHEEDIAAIASDLGYLINHSS